MRTFAVLLPLAFGLAPSVEAQSTELFISEYIEGTSNNKAIEIYNGTGAPVNLATGGYSIQMFFNGSSTAGLTINLTGTIAAGDVYVIAQASANATILAQADQTNGSGWFNGDDAVVLRKGTTVIDVIGQIGFDPGAEWGSGLTSTADNTLRRRTSILQGDPIGNDVFDPAIEWDGFATDTFGCLGAYDCTPPPPPPPTELTICQIQGAGAASPYVGVNAVTRGNVVSAVASNGFFIQVPDGIAATGCGTGVSRGLFAFTNTAPTVAVGAAVDVTGAVSEFFQMTEITVSAVSATGSLGVPPPVVFGPGLPAQSWSGAVPELERYEGMLVRVENGVVAGPADGFGDFYVVARADRPFREPGIAAPGLPGLPVWDGNPEIFEVNPGRLQTTSVIDERTGAGVAVTVEGPLAFDFGDYQIWPTSLETGGEATARPVRDRAAGEFTVATQNLLRLFDTVNDPDKDDAVLTPAEYAVRLAKVSALVRGLLGAPDILVVQEVENLQVLQDLAVKIGADDSALVYTAHLLEGNDIGGIDIGFLVRDTVAVDGLGQIGKDSQWTFNGAIELLNDRPPLVLEGRYLGSVGDPGAPFPITVIGVHQRSLNGIEGTSSSAQRVRAKRYQQAAELATVIQSLQAGTPGLRLVVAGDFNAFEFTDGYVDVMGIVTGVFDQTDAIVVPPEDFVEPNLTNWTSALAPEERYSFVFEGSAQSLDHVLTSDGLTPWVRAVAHARGNAAAAESQLLDAATVLRTADHDGTVLFVMGDFDGDGFADDGDTCVRSDTRPTVIVGDVDTGVVNVLFSNGCTIGDSIAELQAAAAAHGDFVSGVTALMNSLAQQGIVPVNAKGKVVNAAAQSEP